MLYYNPSKAFKLKAVIAGIICVFSFNQNYAQESDTSPWSRFGLGITLPSNTLPQQLMGGVSSPVMDKNVINPNQPASAAGCNTTLFQSSVYSSRNAMTEGDSSTTAFTGNLGAINMIIKKPSGKSAFMFGVIPHSTKGYNLIRSYENELVGDIIESYRGSGGTARSYLGLARGFKGKKWIEIGDSDSILVNNCNLQIGGQVNYLFGEIVQQERLDIQDLAYLDNRTSTTMRHRAMGGLFGLQIHQLLGTKYDDQKNFKRSSSIFIGGTYSTPSKLNTDFEKIIETVVLLNSVESVVDTAFYTSDIFEGQTPSRWTAGAAISFDSGSGRRILLGADLMKENWTSINDGTNDYLLDGNVSWADASRISTGISLKPGLNGSGKNVFARTTYKAGFAIENYPLNYEVSDGNFEQLQSWRASAGFTMPLEGSRSNSSIHFGVSYAKRSLDGTVLDNSLEESIFNLQLGVSLAPFIKNLWLMPKLYD